jgi:hypothetical protein
MLLESYVYLVTHYLCTLRASQTSCYARYATTEEILQSVYVEPHAPNVQSVCFTFTATVPRREIFVENDTHIVVSGAGYISGSGSRGLMIRTQRDHTDYHPKTGARLVHHICWPVICPDPENPASFILRNDTTPNLIDYTMTYIMTHPEGDHVGTWQDKLVGMLKSGNVRLRRLFWVGVDGGVLMH